MVFEASYRNPKTLPDPYAQFLRVEYFECERQPERLAIVSKLKELHKRIDEASLALQPRPEEASALRRNGFRVTKI
jgi:hypothetical protein